MQSWVVSQKLFNKHFVAPCTNCTPPQVPSWTTCLSLYMYIQVMYLCSLRCSDCRHRWSCESHLSLMDPHFLSVEAGEGSQSPSLTALQQLMQDQAEQMVKGAKGVSYQGHHHSRIDRLRETSNLSINNILRDYD